MSLPAPKLDDRTFQDLVREARAMIPRLCPEWTDHNLSDPGIALIELFAWMVDLLLYRLNRVPGKNYIKFMDLIGVRLEPPQPARADVVFRLSAAQPGAVTIPRGTEVATVRTEMEEAITFITDRDLRIFPPTLLHALISPDASSFEDCMAALKHPDQRVSIFESPPKPGNALYLGYAEDLSAQMLLLNIASIIEGIGVDPKDPPLAWEMWDNQQEKWAALRLEKDSTGGLNTNGQVILHAPYGCSLTEINGETACWIRCRATEPREGQRPYHSSPRVTTLTTQSIGGTVPVSHAARTIGEPLGQSSGNPGQNFFLQNTPVLERKPDETIEVETNTPGEFEPWQEVATFAHSGQYDRHFTCDSVSGELRFGPSIRQPSGEERQYGMVPPVGRRIRFTSYRSGGGIIGNVGPGRITVLKSSIPYVASVINHDGARGGTDPETMERAMFRAPEVLRARTSAITADDFEYLALEASSLVARARCAAAGGTGNGSSPGAVRLMLVPSISDTDRHITREELELSRQVREEVQAYLDERRLLGTRLELAMPEYQPVRIAVRIKGKPESDLGQVASEVERRLYRYINPVDGGPDLTGWPFGRGISLSDVYSQVQQINGIDYIEEVKLFPVDPETGEQGEAVTQVSVEAGSLICSDKHEVEVTQ